MPLSLAPEDMLYMYRGVHCEKLTWDEHIETISKKINVGIVAVRHIMPYVSSATNLQSTYSKLFYYCSPLWDTCGKHFKLNCKNFNPVPLE